MVRTCLAASLTVLLFASPLSAATEADADTTAIDATIAKTPTVEQPASRGVALPILYGTLIGLQAYDGWSTATAVRLGAVEANPVMARVASDPGAIWALKVGATTASIYAAERLWRRHRRVEAIATMVAVNGMMVAVAARNASAMRQLK